MCIRDRLQDGRYRRSHQRIHRRPGRRHLVRDAARTRLHDCLLYTSDAADERSSVDLGGRRIIKKKIDEYITGCISTLNNQLVAVQQETRLP